jgi:hypothetical protein
MDPGEGEGPLVLLEVLGRQAVDRERFEKALATRRPHPGAQRRIAEQRGDLPREGVDVEGILDEPVRPSRTTSGLPPKRVATTGFPCSIASRFTSPNVSKQIDGVAKTSVAA